MKRWLTTAAVFLALMAPALATADPTNPNDPDYWEQPGRFPHEVTACHKDFHGDIVLDGLAVQLRPFEDDWNTPADHWEAIIVKGGSTVLHEMWGPGNSVYIHPDTETAYFPPLNAGGESPAVSHYIVCKGVQPLSTTTTTTVTTTTTTLPPSSTTAPTTTTTTSSTTTTVTTAPPSTTTTAAPPTTSTSTVPPVSSTTSTSTSAPPTTNTDPPPPTLPATGLDTGDFGIAGTIAMLAGLGLVGSANLRRRGV